MLSKKFSEYVQKSRMVVPAILKVYPSKNNILKDKNWATKLSNEYLKLINKNGKCSVRHFLHFHVLTIKKIIQESEALKKEITENLKENFIVADDSTKFFITKIFFESGLLDNEVLRLIMSYSLETTDKEYRYFTALEVTMQTFRYALNYYPEYFNERKKILYQIIKDCKLSVSTPYHDIEKKKLCIVAYMLDPSLYNSMQRIVSLVANQMSKYYDEILVVCLDSFYVSTSEAGKVYTCYERKLAKYTDRDKICEAFNPNVRVLFSEDVPYVERYQNALNSIYDFGPSAILDITDECSSLSWIYSKDYPVYYIPMRGGGSSAEYTYYVGLKWKCETVNQKYNCYDLTKIKEWMFPEYIPIKGEKIEKKDLGLSEDNFVIISVGNNIGALSNTLIDCMREFLFNNPMCIWLLVGSEGPDYLKKSCKNLLLEKRIIEWGFEKNLFGLCNACDVMLRPNMSGGSGATAMGCLNGLPIVMTNYMCDPMRWLGFDYSTLESEQELIDEIDLLMNNKEYYKSRSKVSIDKVNTAIDSDYWFSKLFGILESR